jgi:tetratricopeptide (TPR) repeat protein
MRSIVRLASAWLLVAAGAAPARALTLREARERSAQALSQGTQLYEQGDYRKAIELLRQAAAIHLNSFQAHFQLGVALREAREYEEAIEALGVASELNPRHLLAQVALGDCYLKMGDVREAEARYQRALDLQPDYAAAYDGLARLREALGRPDDAVDYYRRAIEANAGYPDAHLNLGDLYQRQGRLEEAASLLLKAIQIRPDFAAAFNRLGVVFARQHLRQEAIAALREAERLEPKNPFHPFTLGRNYVELGSPARAREALERALALDPSFPEVYIELAKLKRGEGDYTGALATLVEGLGRVGDPQDRELLQAERDRFDAERARAERLRLAVESGGGVKAAFELGRHWAEAGDFEAAARALEGQVDADRDPTETVAEWGYYLLKARRYAEARPVFTALSRRSRDDYGSWVNLGIAESGSGRYDEALSAYLAALRLRPEAPEAMLYLGNLYLRRGEYQRARDSYQGYLKTAAEEAGAGRVRRVLELLDRLQGAGSPAGVSEVGR